MTGNKRKPVIPMKVLKADENAYPSLLKKTDDYPSQIWVTGDESVLQLPHMIAIVGSREATLYGIEITKKLSSELVRLGFVIVSGMAEGIDTAAHEGALEAGGKTIAVLGTGICKTFPAANKILRKQIESNGCVISELEPEFPGANWTFPRRNRIISGLSMGVVVVEAGLKSGSLITARLAAEQGREVFAIPGPITSKASAGTHYLIQTGAKLVTQVSDIVSEFSQFSKLAQSQLSLLSDQKVKVEKTKKLDLSVEEKSILKILSQGKKHIDTLSHESGFPMNTLSPLLLDMEMNDYIKPLPGSLFEAKVEVD